MNLKEGLCIGLISITSLFSSGCKLIDVVGDLKPGETHNTGEMPFGDNFTAECSITHNLPDIIFINQLNQTIFLEMDDNLLQAKENYYLKEAIVTGVVSEVWTFGGLRIDLDLGDHEIVIHLQSNLYREDEVESWKHKSLTFTGKIIDLWFAFDGKIELLNGVKQ